MTQQNDLGTPWSLRFDRDGTEDIAVICDADGDALVTSRPFWLPEADDPKPGTLACLRLMKVAPKLLGALQWLLDDLTDAQEDRNPATGVEYDSVANARGAIAEATGRAA